MELKLAPQKSLALTSLERQLETELGEFKRTTEQLAENRRISEARDAAILSTEEAEEAQKLDSTKKRVNCIRISHRRTQER